MKILRSHLLTLIIIVTITNYSIVVFSDTIQFCSSVLTSPRLMQYLPQSNFSAKPAFKFLEKNYRSVQDSEVLTRLESVHEKDFGKGPLRIAIWNTYKWQGENISRDFKILSQTSDLFLTQEAVVNNQSKAALDSNSEKEWWLAKSFYDSDGTSNGVATGSHVQPLEVAFVRSDAREPLTASPKMALLSTFKITETSSPLLVINVHMINFVSDSSFESMLLQVAEALDKHTGPILFGGDFNTWSDSRMFLLKTLTEKHSLIHAIPNDDSRFIQFDHLFTRGFKVTKGQVLTRIQSSDHYPLYFEVEFDEPF